MKLLDILFNLFAGGSYSAEIDNNAYHECGHAIISNLFDNVFDIEFITIDTTISRAQDIRTLGGMKGRLRKKPNEMTSLEIDEFILINLAGLCADNINNNKGKIPKDYYSISNWSKIFNRQRYRGDIEYVGGFFALIKERTDVRWQDYIANSLNMLHEIFSNRILWNSLNTLKTRLEKSNTLDSDEIKNCLQKTYFYQYRENNITKIKEARARYLNFIN